eukprot:3216667-Pleurochrysis_carterae.AAC.1
MEGSFIAISSTAGRVCFPRPAVLVRPRPLAHATAKHVAWGGIALCPPIVLCFDACCWSIRIISVKQQSKSPPGGLSRSEWATAVVKGPQKCGGGGS